MLTILDLANHFGLKTIHGSQKSLKRPIKRSAVDRPGLELTGFFKYHQKDKICLIGNKEVSLLSTLSSEQIYENMLKICQEECPGIIFTHANPIPREILKACQDTDTPLFVSPDNTSNLMSTIMTYLVEKLAPHTYMHACLLEVYGEGVIFLGESGIGKSEISLELIKKGHRLVSDDKVDIISIRGQLIGKAPDILFGMMEVRGIGIIDVPRMFGINALCKQTEIKYAIQLVPFKKNEPLERLGMRTEFLDILGEKRPLVRLPVSAARSMAEIIEAAVTNFKLKDFGYDSAFEFEKRMDEIFKRGKK